MQQRVGAYPAYGQSIDKFMQDSRECEWWAQNNAVPAGGAVAAGTLGGAAVGAGLGAAFGAIAGSFVGSADSGAALGAALGGVSGATSGASAAAQSVEEQQLASYGNCMAARGYAVGGVVPPPPPASSAPAPAPMAAETDTALMREPGLGLEDRLRRLSELRRTGLITEKEYRDHRRRIIDEL